MNSFWLEIIKTALQLAGALGVAWLSVRLALRRYKSEKMWERRIGLCADALGAMEEMKRVLDIWIDVEEGTRRPISTEYDAELRERYRTARKAFERVNMLGRLELPDELSSVLSNCIAKLEKRHDTLFETYDHDAACLKATIEELIAEGRPILGAH